MLLTCAPSADRWRVLQDACLAWLASSGVTNSNPRENKKRWRRGRRETLTHPSRGWSRNSLYLSSRGNQRRMGLAPPHSVLLVLLRTFPPMSARLLKSGVGDASVRGRPSVLHRRKKWSNEWLLSAPRIRGRKRRFLFSTQTLQICERGRGGGTKLSCGLNLIDCCARVEKLSRRTNSRRGLAMRAGPSASKLRGWMTTSAFLSFSAVKWPPASPNIGIEVHAEGGRGRGHGRGGGWDATRILGRSGTEPIANHPPQRISVALPPPSLSPDSH